MKTTKWEQLWTSLVGSKPGLRKEDVIRIIHSHRVAKIRNLALEHLFTELPGVWQLRDLLSGCEQKQRCALAKRVWQKLQKFELTDGYLQQLYQQLPDFEEQCALRAVESSSSIEACFGYLQKFPRLWKRVEERMLASSEVRCVNIVRFIKISKWSKCSRLIDKFLKLVDANQAVQCYKLLVDIVRYGNAKQKRRAMNLLFGADCPEVYVIAELVDYVPRSCTGLVEEIWQRILTYKLGLEFFLELYDRPKTAKLRSRIAKHVLGNFEIDDVKWIVKLSHNTAKSEFEIAVVRIEAVENPEHEYLREMIHEVSNTALRQRLLDKLYASGQALDDDDRRMFVVYDQGRRVEFSRAVVRNDDSSSNLLCAVVKYAKGQSRSAKAKLRKRSEFLSSNEGLQFVIDYMPECIDQAILAHNKSLETKDNYELWRLISILHQRTEENAQSLVQAAAARIFKLADGAWAVNDNALRMIGGYPTLSELACREWLHRGGDWLVLDSNRIRSAKNLLLIIKICREQRELAFEKLLNAEFPDQVLDQALQFAPEYEAKVKEYRETRDHSTKALLEKLFAE